MRYFTRKEVMQLLGISLMTVYYWEMKGLLKRVQEKPVLYQLNTELILEHLKAQRREIPDFLKRSRHGEEVD